MLQEFRWCLLVLEQGRGAYHMANATIFYKTSIRKPVKFHYFANHIYIDYFFITSR